MMTPLGRRGSLTDTCNASLLIGTTTGAVKLAGTVHTRAHTHTHRHTSLAVQTLIIISIFLYCISTSLFFFLALPTCICTTLTSFLCSGRYVLTESGSHTVANGDSKHILSASEEVCCHKGQVISLEDDSAQS